ncbi:MAG: hypothetical protein JO001_26165 [Alphaproteobacteria bacterium]|nr:hypothetical protein [Alphaproteobacteria bacterium]
MNATTSCRVGSVPAVAPARTPGLLAALRRVLADIVRANMEQVPTPRGELPATYFRYPLF